MLGTSFDKPTAASSANMPPKNETTAASTTREEQASLQRRMQDMIDLQVAYTKQEQQRNSSSPPPGPPSADTLPPREFIPSQMYTATPPVKRVAKSITDEPVLKPMTVSLVKGGGGAVSTARSILPSYGPPANYGATTAASTTSTSYASAATTSNTLPPPPPPPSSLQPTHPLNSSSLSPEDPENPTVVGRGQMVFSSEYPKQGYGIAYQHQQQPSPTGSEERRERMLLMMNTEHPEHPDYVLETGGVGGAPRQHLGLHAEDHPSKDDSPCCCCWNPLVHWLRNSVWTEAVLRSVCFGAIDGTLTGAGIVATFVGLGLLEDVSTRPVSGGGDDDFSSSAQFDISSMMMVIMMCVCFTACVSDSIGMALGHVWSTYWTASQSAQAQKEQRRECQARPTEAKGRLVDLLLSRGMLKIDAISIADTLEGYPDLFLSAVLGAGDMSFLGSAGEDGGGTAGTMPVGMRTSSRDRGLVLAGATNSYKESYGQFKEWELDPEVAAVTQATKEAQVEGLAMMLSFSLVSLVPSFVYLCTCWALTSPSSDSSTTATSSNPSDGDGGAVSIPTVAMTLGSIWMLGLGIWKSRFMGESPSSGSNVGFIFGMETVLVLWICVVSAYAVGRGLWWTVLLKHHETS